MCLNKLTLEEDSKLKMKTAQKTGLFLKYNFVIIIMLCGYGISYAESASELCRKAEAASFTQEKLKYTVSMGKSGTAEAKNCLLRMLEKGDMWGREAAVAGLVYFNDKEVSQALLKTYFNDIHTSSAVLKEISLNPANHYKEIIAAYEAAETDKGWHQDRMRRGLLEMFASSACPEGEAYLKKIVSNAASPDRSRAVELIGRHYKSNYMYMTALINDKELRPRVLDFLVEKGTAADLPRLMEPIDNKESAENILIAYKGVSRYGKQDLKHKIYLSALHETDESLVQGALLTFEGLTGEKIKLRLCCLAAAGTYQRTRMLAGLGLTGYSDKKIIPFLIPLLKEEYIQRERGGVDMFIAGLTLGISSIMDDLSEKSKRSGFKEIILKIHAHLKKTAGIPIENDFAAWNEWAVHEGYTVDGKNIIQYLFSPDISVRKKAAASAVRLLGAGSLESLAAEKGIDINDEQKLIIHLADELVKTGMLEKGLPPCSEK
jgi:hypothetical protein